MEWLSLITVLCLNKVDADVKRPDCQQHFEKCVNWIYERPETKGYTKDEIAVWLLSSKKARVTVCK